MTQLKSMTVGEASSDLPHPLLCSCDTCYTLSLDPPPWPPQAGRGLLKFVSPTIPHGILHKRTNQEISFILIVAK